MTERTYEMLWDCSHCGTKKNLGLTHRHCPNCGSPQDAAARYFPAEQDKVAVQDHHYVGVDQKCAYCGALSSRSANNCGGCGAPLAEGTAAQKKETQVGQWGGGPPQAPPPQPSPGVPPPAAKPSSPNTKYIGIGCGALALIGLIAILVLVFWKKEGSAEVIAHRWTRSIAIESMQRVEESAWCDQTPPGVSIERRSREVRSTQQVQDGQECRTVRIDNGDGTFTERQECQPRYRQEPVYAEKCYFMANRWRPDRTATASGNSLHEEPAWPALQLRGGECLGCEREGARTEEYLVEFRVDGESDTTACNFPQPKWSSLAVGSQHKVLVSAVTGSLDCDSVGN